MEIKYQVAASTWRKILKSISLNIFLIRWKNAKKVPSYLLKLISAMFNSFSGSVNIETLYFVQLSRVSMILTEWSGWILHWSDIGERWFLILIRYILNSTRQSNRKFLLKDCRFFYTFTNLFKNLFFNITRFYFNCWGPYKIVCQQKSNKKIRL